MMRTPPWLKPWLLLPAYAINGIGAALGIFCIQLVATFAVGPHAAPLIVSGAICASLADLPNTVPRTWHRVGAAALLSASAALLVDLLRGHPFALGAAVALVAFAAMMTLAWGARAGAVSFTPVLGMVFAMAVPPSGHPFEVAGWSACGALAYLGWALLAGTLCQRRYRTLALVQALRASAQLFHSRADVLRSADAGADAAESGAPLRAWISGEAVLADRLQAARDFLFAAGPTARSNREIAVLLRAIDLRDVLLASRLDADLLGADATARAIHDHIAASLDRVGDQLDRIAGRLQRGTGADELAPAPADRAGSTGDSARADPSGSLRDSLLADPTGAHRDPSGSDAAGSHTASSLQDIPMAAGDARARLFPSLLGRLQQLDAGVDRMHRLLQGAEEPLPLTRPQLQLFVAPEGWPLAALRPHWRADSLVLRHAVRMGLALGTAYYLALLLPWGSHPYWLVLSVAVVLRGKLGETLARRNARVVGTVVGCLIVVGLSHLPSTAALNGAFIVALGIAHSFTVQLYWVTATAASVMALLQSHRVDPAAGFAIGERVADTFLGALLAWCFSYVLPSWERRSVREAIGRVLRDLHSYASHSLQPASTNPVEERLARRRAYDALSALAAALQRSRVEPRGVRLPAAQIATLLDHGERLMAHLSIVRLTLARVKNEPVPWPPIDAALGQTAAALAVRLDARAPLASAVDAASGIDLELLPEQPAIEDVMPWLRRRLALMVHEAGRIQAVARSALAPG